MSWSAAVSLPGNAALSLPPLLWRDSWRHVKRHRWQAFLGFLGIVLGVMMVVAVDLASNSARRAFQLSIASIDGSLTHQIVGAQGVPDAVFTGIRLELGLRRSAPGISGELRWHGQTFTLIGLDAFSEADLQRERPGMAADPMRLRALGAAALATPHAVLMHPALATRLGLAETDDFTPDLPATGTSLQLAALPEGLVTGAEGEIAFADIATAQAALGKLGRLDSIDLILTDDEAARLQAWLPASLSLIVASQRNSALEQMTEAFHVNLLAMSLLALLVAALLIFNTVSLSVLDRRENFGVLRALGTTSTQLTRLILLEVALQAALASAVGVLAGLLLASQLVELVTRTIDDLYFNLTVTAFHVSPWLLLKGFFWGFALALLAGLLPALEAGRSLPITLQHKGLRALQLQHNLFWVSALAMVLMCAGVLVLRIESGSLVLGFLALFLLIFGFCLLVPLVMQGMLSLLLTQAATRLSWTWRLALRSIQSSLDRTALAVAALTVAVSVTVGVGIMVGSFRDTVGLWLDQSLQGDVQLSRFDEGGITAELQALVESLPGVAAVSQGFQLDTESSVGTVRVQAESGAAHDWLYMKNGESSALALDDSVFIAEPLAALHKLDIGSTLQLQTGTGSKQLQVRGIFHDYSTGLPLVALALPQLRYNWPALPPTRLTLTLDEPESIDAVVRSLRDMLSEYPGRYGVAANRDIRTITFAIFDRTFAITDVLRLLAIVVAFVGVLGALLAMQLQQLGDYAVLRASGMTVLQVAMLIGQQTAVLGLFAGLLALPLGLLMSQVLIDVINWRSFGWSMQHSLPPRVLFEAVLLALFAALLAGLHPARRVAAVEPAAALRGE
jgi:putative ABC transport system permease protein